MKNAIIIHGMPGKDEYYSPDYPAASNFQWLPWLQKQLLIKDVFAVTPEMPLAFMPEYNAWKREFERHDITSETILVGHSCGAGFLVRWLSEHKDVKVGSVFLVAPWIDPDKALATGMFDFEIDPEFVSRTAGTTIYVSDNDDSDIHTSVKLITKLASTVHVREFAGRGHFLIDRFPELRDDIISGI
jgi:predicted alpha/beta hydrolase family esterase